MPKVVHCKKNPTAYYIGRKASGMHFGNPFSHKKDALAIRVPTIGDAISRFKTWLLGQSDLDLEQERRQWILKNIYLLKDKDLGCWCGEGKPCHGLVYLELLY